MDLTQILNYGTDDTPYSDHDDSILLYIPPIVVIVKVSRVSLALSPEVCVKLWGSEQVGRLFSYSEYAIAVGAVIV